MWEQSFLIPLCKIVVILYKSNTKVSRYSVLTPLVEFSHFTCRPTKGSTESARKCKTEVICMQKYTFEVMSHLMAPQAIIRDTSLSKSPQRVTQYDLRGKNYNANFYLMSRLGTQVQTQGTLRQCSKSIISENSQLISIKKSQMKAHHFSF